jgi:hydroxymethylglutaryl-CoA reductase
MNRRKQQIIKLKEYYSYLKSFEKNLEDIDIVTKYCENMILHNSIPLKFVIDREIDAEYYYTMVKNKFSNVMCFSNWSRKHSKKTKQK